ncbi:hypothetical protein [Peribacillus simplex]|uniref:hypothetical protein n=1 Tax=Peribacillus simplex TaxID=1478 RepID=UPI0021A9EEC6|nr:hypothetical protein [Peribacillus simplex]
MNTLTSYAVDLRLYGEFLTANNRSLDLDELTSSSVRLFVQDQSSIIVLSQERYNAAFRA